MLEGEKHIELAIFQKSALLLVFLCLQSNLSP